MQLSISGSLILSLNPQICKTRRQGRVSVLI